MEKEKVIVLFGREAEKSFAELKNGHVLFSDLAIRYYNELFEIPPEKWGRIRRENGTDTFVSEHHCIFDIRGILEDTSPLRTINITHFELRKKTVK